MAEEFVEGAEGGFGEGGFCVHDPIEWGVVVHRGYE